MTAMKPDLLEREVESAAVARVVKDVGQGGGGLLLVEGSAGIGKTRLLAEVRAAGAGGQVVSARGTQLERDFAFGMVRQLFEPLLADADGAVREALWQGPAAQARRVFAQLDPVTEPAGDFAVLHGLYWLTANAAQDCPLLLVVDDLQWCDVPSLRYLAYLLPRIEDLGVLVAAALRTGEEAADEHLLQQITTDQAATVLRPHPLSARATALLMERALPGPVDPHFAAACHVATGGNPLLLRELARTITTEGITASAENVALIQDLGSRAVARLVAVRMAHLPEATIALARAAAVLGDHSDLTTVAALAGQDTTTALEGAAHLERLQILRSEQRETGLRLPFIHPLVKAAVNDSIDSGERAVIHHNAAKLLTTAGADPERIAAHLLHTPPSGNSHTVATLRTSAATAVGRGAPGGAYSYLRRALAEPPPAEQLLAVLTEAGQAALLVDLEAAASHLQQAYDQTTDPVARADLAGILGTAYAYLLKFAEGLSVMSQALTQLPTEKQEHGCRLQAAVLTAAAWFVPSHHDVLSRLPEFQQPSHDSVGGRLLDVAIAGHLTLLGDPDALPRARRALAAPSLVHDALGDIALPCGWIALLASDDDTTIDSLNTAVEHAHRHGSLYALVPAYSIRAWAWLYRGQLAEAEHDARESRRLADLMHLDINRFFGGAFLAQALAEQGRLDEADQVLNTTDITATDSPGPSHLALTALALLQRLRGNHQDALEAALRAQQVCQAYDIHNPAVVGWRSEAALALHALGRTGEAQALAGQELDLALRWRAPRALGQALRVNGLVTSGDNGLRLLQEAVGVLESSPARLEHAKALADYGAALRRAGHRAAAREPLRQALDLSTRCGASPVVAQARTQFAAAGGRPRRTALTGPGALTPSERRVAEIASDGATNRQIAQTLFVTPKTVEVHLSAIYRKLGISTRARLPEALQRQG